MNLPKEVNKYNYLYKYSFCTVVTNINEYKEMVNSFSKKGFDNDSEFLYVNNSEGNKFDAYEGLNLMLSQAKGENIILLHQDILALDDKSVLEKCLLKLDSMDPSWAVAGNCGANGLKVRFKYFTNGKNEQEKLGKLPAKVISLDENILILKNSANLAFSHDLMGFHFYGTDIVLNAKRLGFNSYVIPFMILHKSFGNMDKTFYNLKRKFIDKQRKALNHMFIETSCVRFYISSSRLLNKIFNTTLSIFIFKEISKFKNKYKN